MSHADQRRLSHALAPLARAAEAVVPYPNPVGLPRPEHAAQPHAE
jgi:hypothetical protein